MTTTVTMSEADLLDNTVELAHLFGWKCAHFRPAMTKHGWRTPVAADGKGWPDLVLCRDRVLFVELKSDIGKRTPEQEQWGDTLYHAGADYFVWRPADWTSGRIEEALR